MLYGDYACFTRPERKERRISYAVPTPGAMEGLLRSIYWKPGFRYCIDRIVVFNEISYANVRFNEQTSIHAVKYPDSTARVLKDVCYGVEFHVELTGFQCERAKPAEMQFDRCLRRALEKKQYYRRPCFGSREFPVRSIVPVARFPLNSICASVLNPGDVDLGSMLYHMEYSEQEPFRTNGGPTEYRDSAVPLFYHPHMVNGIIDVRVYAEQAGIPENS